MRYIERVQAFFILEVRHSECVSTISVFSDFEKTDNPDLLEGDGSMFKADLNDLSTVGRKSGILVSGSACKALVSFNC